jgi:chromate transporter
VTPSLRELIAYFLRLGTLGFGGPIALTAAMERDLVAGRGWFTSDEYRRGLTLAQLAPGPLAAQLAIYLGWARHGLRGATAVAFAFVLPSFVMVVALGAAYVRFGEMPWLGRVFYGVGAAVIAVMLRSVARLTTRTMQRDVLLWMLFAINAVATAVTEGESVALILGCGLALLMVRRAPRMMFAAAIPDQKLWKLAVYFAEAGTFVFGSGLAIVPFLHGGVVEQHRWLTEQQFLDAVAVAMITPGPVVITVAFIGYLASGFAGAVVAAVAVFLPCYLFVVVPAPFYERVANNASLRAFIDGVTAAAIGAIAGAIVVLGRRAIVDRTSLTIGIAALLLLSWKRMPEPAVIAAAAVAGLFFSA